MKRVADTLDVALVRKELLSNLVYGMVLIRRRACMDRCDCLIRFH